MTVAVFGIDALDPDLVNPESHPHLTLEAHSRVSTINSSAGEPSTHELWPTIITGLPPSEHGIQLDDGVAWDSPALRFGSRVAEHLLPGAIRTWLGNWLLTNTGSNAFQIPATYYPENDISTLFDDRNAKAIGIPNYVVDTDSEDREHKLRQRMGDLFKRDQSAQGGHTSSDPDQFYELCLEMSMIRTARIRRALRSQRYELVFGYTSGVDLIGHVSHNRQPLQKRAYNELNDFVGELRADLNSNDELILISDHGLQDGLHTEEAVIASTKPEVVEQVESIVDVYESINAELDRIDHTPAKRASSNATVGDNSGVREQLEDLGYV